MRFNTQSRRKRRARLRPRSDNPDLPIPVTGVLTPPGAGARPDSVRLFCFEVANCLTGSLLFALRDWGIVLLLALMTPARQADA